MPRFVASFDCTADCLFTCARRIVESDSALETSTGVVCGLCSFGRSYCFVRRALVDIVLDVFINRTSWRWKERLYRRVLTLGCSRCRLVWTRAARLDVVDSRRRRLRFSFGFLRLLFPGTLVAVVRDASAQ